MRAPAQYVALRDIQPEGTYACAARKGDDISESVRANLGLTVGLDVMPLAPGAMERPADDAPRSEWQNYAVTSGVPYAEAVDLDADALMARADEASAAEAAPDAASATRPDESDLKAAWIEYAALELVKASAYEANPDAAREVAARRTKAELITAFGAEQGDESAALRGAMLEDLGDRDHGRIVQVGDRIVDLDAPAEPTE